MDAHAADEELPLIEQTFVSNMPEALMYLPSYGEWLLQADQRQSYAELTDWLKILQWQTPGRSAKKWMLKTPHHLTAVQTVLETFPDAVVVMTHRRVDHVIASFASMVGSLTGGSSDADLGAAQAVHWCQRLRRNMASMMSARQGAEHRFVDVHYRELIADPMAHAHRIFAAAGIATTAADEAAWAGWLIANKRDNRPSHQYDLGDYGLSSEEVMRDFAFYSEAFAQHWQAPA
jgi:hypothetical protein